MKAPAFQFYPKDFLVDTVTLTAEQTGCYIRLLSVAWVGIPGCKQTQLPIDDHQLAVIAGVPDAQWERIKAPVLACFRRTGERLVHDRLARELAKQKERSAKKQKAANARWKRTSADATASPVHKQERCIDDALQLQSSSASALPTTPEATPPAPIGAPRELTNQQARVKAVLDLWEGVPEGLHPSGGLVARWLGGWNDDAALIGNLIEIKAEDGFHRGGEYVTKLLRTRWQNGKQAPPPLKDSRRPFRRPLPPGADDERRRQASELEAELRRMP